MGKDKRKGIERSNSFEYQFGTGKVGELMKRYGVEGTKSVKPDNRGYGGNYNRTSDDVDRDLAEAMMNDYDTRRGMEAAAMAGNKDAKKFAKKGFKAGNIYSGFDTLKDLKKEYVGGGGMNGAKNEAGLTQALVQADREAQEENLVSKDFLDERLNALKDKFKTKNPEADEPVEYIDSPEVAAAKERLDSDYYNTSESMYRVNTKNPTTAFRQTNENVPARDDASTAVASYLDQYKKDLIKGGRIGEARTDNLNNAYNTVIGNDI